MKLLLLLSTAENWATTILTFLAKKEPPRPAIDTFIKYVFRFFEPYCPMLTFKDLAKSRHIKGRGAEIFSKF